MPTPSDTRPSRAPLALGHADAAQTSTPMSAHAYEDPWIQDGIECLLLRIQAGEDPTREETTAQWRADIERRAADLFARLARA